MDRRRILYFDQAPAAGGSVVSLYHLVANMDRSRFEPVVLLRDGNSHVERFRSLGVEVLTYGQARVAGPAETRALQSARHGRLAGLLRRTALGQKLVQAVGFLLRTWPAVRHDADELTKIMGQVQPDLVHLNDVVCVNRAAIVAASRLGLPAISHVRAIAPRSVYDRWLSKRLCGYVCISQAVREHLVNLGGKTEPNWVVHNGLDLAEFADLDEQAAAFRDELGFAPERPLIGCVSRLVHWKGVHVFVEAMAEVLAKHPEARAVIVGSPEENTVDYAEGLRQRVRALGLEDMIRFQDYRPDIAGVLASLDIMVHASVAPEPFGRIVIEGMAAGAAVIAMRDGAIPEIIDDGVTGLMAPPDDAHAMACAVLRALDSPADRQAWQQAARRDVSKRFTVQRYVAGVQQVYEQVFAS